MDIIVKNGHFEFQKTEGNVTPKGGGTCSLFYFFFSCSKRNFPITVLSDEFLLMVSRLLAYAHYLCAKALYLNPLAFPADSLTLSPFSSL